MHPTIDTTEPTIAYTDVEPWTVHHRGGIHCPYRHPQASLGCCLPDDHTGDCIPTSDDLLHAGFRLEPVARLD